MDPGNGAGITLRNTNGSVGINYSNSRDMLSITKGLYIQDGVEVTYNTSNAAFRLNKSLIIDGTTLLKYNQSSNNLDVNKPIRISGNHLSNTGLTSVGTLVDGALILSRSEERRVGKEC